MVLQNVFLLAHGCDWLVQYECRVTLMIGNPDGDYFSSQFSRFKYSLANRLQVEEFPTSLMNHEFFWQRHPSDARVGKNQAHVYRVLFPLR